MGYPMKKFNYSTRIMFGTLYGAQVTGINTANWSFGAQLISVWRGIIVCWFYSARLSLGSRTKVLFFPFFL